MSRSSRSFSFFLFNKFFNLLLPLKQLILNYTSGIEKYTRIIIQQVRFSLLPSVAFLPHNICICTVWTSRLSLIRVRAGQVSMCWASCAPCLHRCKYRLFTYTQCVRFRSYRTNISRWAYLTKTVAK